MLVISENLKGLVRELKICEPVLVEEFSLKICIDRRIRRMRKTPALNGPVKFNSPFEPEPYFEEEEQLASELIIEPKQNVLACSSTVYNMPTNYFGLVQTKGSLARLFVSATANDGQVEPGYRGKITLELTNHANYPVAIPLGANVAQLFLFRCTTEALAPYSGKYQDATSPTTYRFE